MIISGTTIITPNDDSTAYSPDWRHLVARAVISGENIRVPRKLSQDRYIHKQIVFLQGGMSAVSAWESEYNKINNIYEGIVNPTTNDRLEALLLTKVSFKSIAADFNMSELEVKLYERLFFNIRDEEGNLLNSPLLRNNFSLGTLTAADDMTPDDIIWKCIANRCGAAVLTTKCWGWSESECAKEESNSKGVLDHTYEMAQVLLLEKLVRGQLNGRELAEIIKSNVAYLEEKREASESDKEKEESLNSFELEFRDRVLERFKPSMLPIVVTKEDEEDYDKELSIKADAVIGMKNIQTDKIKELSLDKLSQEIDNKVNKQIKKD
jgi:hypothetical protein